jgi:hypothetical protein
MSAGMTDKDAGFGFFDGGQITYGNMCISGHFKLRNEGQIVDIGSWASGSFGYFDEQKLGQVWACGDDWQIFTTYFYSDYKHSTQCPYIKVEKRSISDYGVPDYDLVMQCVNSDTVGSAQLGAEISN